MAEGNPTYGTDGLVALTIAHRVKQLVDQVFKKNVLLFLLGGAEGKSPRGVTGRSIVQELLYGDQSNVGSFADDDVFAAPSRGGITAAEFPWRRFKGSLMISGEEMDANSGPEAAVNLAEARLKQTMRTMAKNLNSMLYADGTGNGGKDLQGLAALFAQANVYGGIDRSDALNAFWRADTTNVAGAYDEADLRHTYNNVVDGAEKPTHIITTQEGYESYEGLIQDTIRHEDTELGDAGFDSLMFKSTPMVFDRDVQDGVLYFLNMDHIELVSNNNRWFTPSDWLRPVNQDVQLKNIISSGNLVTDQANLQAQITGATNA
jgi:hypothetical protein